MVRFLILIITFVCSFLLAQNQAITTEQKRQLKIADKLMEQRSYYNAIEKYLQYDKAQPGNEEVVFKLANAFYITRDYKNAEKFLIRYTSNKEYKKHPEALFYLGEVLKSRMKYDEAQEAFLKFSKIKAKNPKLKDLPKWNKNELNACEWVKTFLNEDSTGHKATRLLGNMNRAYSDFSPFPIHHDTLIFASLPNDSIIQYGHEDNHFNSVKLFETVRQDNSWSAPIELNEYNTNYEHTANGVLSPDGRYFYFTRCKPDRDNKIVCDLYYVEYDHDKIKQHKAKKVSNVNFNDFNTTQPTFQSSVKKSKKGVATSTTVLYFSSDRPGGQGGKDIWFTQMISPGKFKKPINCGNKINTTRDEVTPYYDNEKGQLYFSSNYHFGFGGFDVFKSEGKDNKWTKPENLMYPINSSYDDTYYVPVHKKSFDEEAGYMVSNRPGGIALHSETCCDDIYYFKERDPEKYILNGKTFEYQLEKVYKTDTSSVSDTVKLLKTGLQETKIKVNTDSVKVTNKIPFAAVGFIKKKQYDKLATSGDTTFVSLKEYVQWQDTSNQNGEFKLVLEKGKQYVLLAQKENYISKRLLLSSLRTDSARIELIAHKESPTLDTLKIKRLKLTSNTDANKMVDQEKLVLDNLSFEPNSDKLKPSSKPALEVLYNFLNKYPKIKIEISGHCDSKGSEEYNLNLSQRRADIVMDYLVDRNIDIKRLTAIGFGESQPIAPNVNPDGSDNPEGRALNRRLEIKVLSH